MSRLGSQLPAGVARSNHLKGTADHPCLVGDLGNPAASPVRIVHISDTHMLHGSYMNDIPYGDILVHSGDFAAYGILKNILCDRDYCNDVKEIDNFFGRLPHRHKIFVAGNHELNFTNKHPARTQSMLRHGVYLQDASVVLEGIKFYGSPWNRLRESSRARGFALRSSLLEEKWEWIPEDVDVLVTHSPPEGVMDQGMGCQLLTNHVFSRVRPKAHLFGHAHYPERRLVVNDGILFSNAAMVLPHVIDFYVASCNRRNELGPHVHGTRQPQTDSCLVM